MYRVPGTAAPETRGSRLEYVQRVLVYRIILRVLVLLLLYSYVYYNRAHPRFPTKFRRRRLQDFVYR